MAERRERRLFATRYRLAFLFLLPYAFSFLWFGIYPFLKAFPVSMQKYDYVTGRSIFIGLSHYIRAFKDPVFWKAWYNSIYFGIGGLALGFWPPILLAIMVNELKRGQMFWRTFLYIPALCSGIMTAALWKWIYNPEYGLLNYLLGLVGIPPQGWLMDPRLVKISILVMSTVTYTGPGILLYLAALQNIPEQEYEAAEIDGASIFQRMWYITLPGLVPLIKTLFILNIIRLLRTFSEVFLMTGGGPCQASNTLTYYIWLKAFKHLEMGYATAIGVIMFLVTLGLTIINFRALRARGAP
jgi:multiple sugar transport system permease protein